MPRLTAQPFRRIPKSAGRDATNRAPLTTSSKPNSPTNRPLSDGSSANSLATGDPSAGQLYKQRSIRATLAPKLSPSSDGAAAPGAKESASQRSEESGQTADSGASSLHQAKPNSGAHNGDANQSAPGKHANNGANHSHSKPASSASSGASSSHQQQATPSNNSAHTKSSRSSASSQQQSRSHHNQQRSQSNSSHSHASSASSSGSQTVDQVSTNESYVSVLNHCFDDIEKFIIRIQHAATAARELQVKRKLSKRSSGSHQMVNGMGKDPYQVTASELAILSARARGPSDDDYFEILSKFKLAFNLLAKLKGCIHEPNAPELVHFLFTPLAIIIDSARNVVPPVDPTIVAIPYLNQDALDLLSNCCNSKESDMWLSLGPNWTQTIEPNILRASRIPSSFQPIFSDGWAPVISELELIGLVAPSTSPRDRPPPPSNAGGITVGSSSSSSSSSRRLVQANSSTDTKLAVGAPIGPIDSSSYPLEPAGYAPGLLGNGRTKSHASHRNQKKRASPSPGHTRSHGDLLADPYYDPMVLHQPPAPISDERHHYESSRHRVSAHLPTGRAGHLPLDPMVSVELLEQQALRGKQSSSRRLGEERMIPLGHEISHSHGRHRHQSLRPANDELDYLGGGGFSTIGMSEPSDDYSELHNQHLDEMQRRRGGRTNGAAGPSSRHQQRLHKADSHPGKYSQQDTVWPPTGKTSDLYDQSHPDSDYPYESGIMSELEREAMLSDLGPAQTEWFFELQSRGALIVRALFSREANNDKELSVRRGEILEILDDSRKWWRARNINLQVAHVPHTIVAVMYGYQTIDELLTSNPISMANDSDPSIVSSQMAPRHSMPSRPVNYHSHQAHERRNSKAAGAFRYF